MIFLKKSHNTDLFFSTLLVFLALLSLVIGYFSYFFFIGLGSSFFNASIHVNIYSFLNSSLEFLSHKFKVFPIIVSMLGGLSALFLYLNFKFFLLYLKITFYIIYIFFNKRCFFDKLYNTMFTNFFCISVFYDIFILLDRGLFEFLGPKSLIFFLICSWLVCLKTEVLQSFYLFSFWRGLFFKGTCVFNLFSLKYIRYHSGF